MSGPVHSGRVCHGIGLSPRGPYEKRADWVRNVLAAGSATIVHEGETFEVAEPEVIPVEEANREFTPKERREMRLFGNTTCLRVRRVGAEAQGGA